MCALEFSVITNNYVSLLCIDLLNSHVKFVKGQGNEVVHGLARISSIEN